jgi:alkyl sulfatase BDS1-like metallo-beta-lactamase superfamily hydrolase
MDTTVTPKLFAAFIVYCLSACASIAVATTHSDPGSSVDRLIEVETGPKGEVANARLIDRTSDFSKRLYKVTDGVYNLVGVGIANATMIEGETGIIVFDTGDNLEQAREQLAEFRKITDKPVRAIIYSHSHYVQGAKAYVEQGDGEVEIWGSERVNYNYLNNAMGPLSDIINLQGAKQLGIFLPSSGEDAFPNLGLGPYFFNPEHKGVGTKGYLAPNKLVPAQGYKDAVVDGVRMRFIAGFSDEDDAISVWLPDKKVVLTDIVWSVFPNVATLRGSAYRDPARWLAAIDDVRALEAEHLISVHGRPISGKSEVAKALRDYRDALQYVYDQTIRLINKGLTPDEIAVQVQLPEHLASSRLTGQFYGEIAHHVRGIYSGLRGWWGGRDTAELAPVSKSFEGERIVAGFGGPEKVIAAVHKALQDEEYSWAAQLSSFLINAMPASEEAASLKATALRELAQRTTNSIARNFYLTEARILEGKLQLPSNLQLIAPTEEILAGIPSHKIVGDLRYRLDPRKSGDTDACVNLRFSDTGEQFALHLRRGVLEVTEKVCSSSGMNLEISKLTWTRYYIGKLTDVELLSATDAKFSGDKAIFRNWLAYFR